jgi:methylthioribose-1-phosphate isomerase
MLLNGQPSRTLWPAAAQDAVTVLDQRALPHRIESVVLHTVDDAVHAIAEMVVRGAPLIGVTAAYGLALQARVDASDAALERAASQLKSTRPTAVNLAWAVDRMLAQLLQRKPMDREATAWTVAAQLADDDAAVNERLGVHGVTLLRSLAQRTPGRPLNVLTHCNAGWLATVDWGTALSPIYHAQAQGLRVHVWVDETRPRNQGASLTAFELREQGVPHTVIADNAGGHLMQRGQVDAVIVGCDRVTGCGDVANKIGTYLKALAAHDCGVPFWVAMPLSTLDRSLRDGMAEIRIEERSAREVTHLTGRTRDGTTVEVQLVPDGTQACNPAFDVTPARLVTGLITERGVVPATREGIAGLFEERRPGAH